MKRIRSLYYKTYRKAIGLVRVISRIRYESLYKRWMQKAGISLGGIPGYISPDVYFDETDYSKIYIGEGAVISTGVVLLVHDYSIRTACRAYHVAFDKVQKGEIKPVILKENCFIGAKSIILPGAVIGANSIIGAGSIVKGCIPDNVVAAGNPCRVINSLKEYLAKNVTDFDS